MARRSAAPTYQYEPLITPSEWTGEERNFSIRLTQILDNLHAKIGARSSTAGMWAFHINEEGHLICTYDTSSPPPLSINEKGHLIWTLEG